MNAARPRPRDVRRLTIPILAALLLAGPLAGCLGAPGSATNGTPTVTLLTDASFSVSKDVLQSFESSHHVQVRVVQIGDAGATLNAALLNQANPLGDVLYGVDNSLLSRALDHHLFVPYQPDGSSVIPQRFVLDPGWNVTPVDYGYVSLVYDKAGLQNLSLQPPTNLRQLTEPQWRGKLVVENPTTSSTGLAFLLLTVADFGTTGNYTYLDFWHDLKQNDVLVTPGWSAAYYTYFSKYGGDRPLVVSYATDPAAEVYFGNPNATTSPVGTVTAPNTTYYQEEFVGLLRNSTHQALGKQLIDWMISKNFQDGIPTNMFVYPVSTEAKLPSWYSFAKVPQAPAMLPPSRVAAQRDAYLNAWFDAMAS